MPFEVPSTYRPTYLTTPLNKSNIFNNPLSSQKCLPTKTTSPTSRRRNSGNPFPNQLFLRAAFNHRLRRNALYASTGILIPLPACSTIRTRPTTPQPRKTTRLGTGNSSNCNDFMVCTLPRAEKCDMNWFQLQPALGLKWILWGAGDAQAITRTHTTLQPKQPLITVIHPQFSYIHIFSFSHFIVSTQ